MSAEILTKIQEADNLPSLPTVAIRVLQMTQADDLSVADIAEVIQQDPALTGKLLRVVNSSMFGMSRKISSLPQAMVVLGLRTVKIMVLSFSLVDEMNGKNAGGFDYRQYWRRSLTTAVLARQLASQIQRPLSDECFVGGLLCDIGMLAAAQCAREDYRPVIERYNQEELPLQEIEREILGLTHEEITASLLDHWGLPTELCGAIRSHHQPIQAPTPPQSTAAFLTRILRAAAMLADIFTADTRAKHLDSVRKEAIQQMPISSAALDAVLEEVDTHVRETASLFSLAIGETLSYRDIQTQAATQLAQLSMAAEFERAQTARREQEARLRVEELNSRNQALAERAATDALTHIANRAAFEERLAADWERCCREQTSIGLILLDLDRFKKVNDTFGHQTGDEALRQVGAVLKQVVTDTQFAARYGGEEFTLLVVDASARELRALAEEIRLGIAKLRIPFQGTYIPVTVSAGVAHINPSQGTLDPQELIRRADQCLYQAKDRGRNRVVCLDSRQASRTAPCQTTSP